MSKCNEMLEKIKKQYKDFFMHCQTSNFLSEQKIEKVTQFSV